MRTPCTLSVDPPLCPLPKTSGTLNLSYHTFVFFELVPSTPITVGITVTLVARWVLLRSFNFEYHILMLFHLFLLSSKDIIFIINYFYYYYYYYYYYYHYFQNSKLFFTICPETPGPLRITQRSGQSGYSRSKLRRKSVVQKYSPCVPLLALISAPHLRFPP